MALRRWTASTFSRQKDEVRKLLGYLPQEFGLYPKVAAETLLSHFAALKGIENAKERRDVVQALLRQTNLWDHRNKPLGSFSGGMKQRFGIAQALLGNPRLIIVDEPTAGLDPEERVRFHNLLSAIGENIIVILSTHIVSDVSDLCRNMAIIHQGRVRATGDPAALVQALNGPCGERPLTAPQLADYQQRLQVISMHLFAGRTMLHVLQMTSPSPGSSRLCPISKTSTSRPFAASALGRRTDHAGQYLPLRTRPTPAADVDLRVFPGLLHAGNAVCADVGRRLLHGECRLRHRRKGPDHLALRAEQQSSRYICFFGIVITAAIAGQATYQDIDSNSAVFFYTAPITKLDYLGGRFLAAFAIQVLIFSSVGLGAWIGTLTPWLDKTRVGPQMISAYFQPYFINVLPNLLFLTAIFFALGDAFAQDAACLRRQRAGADRLFYRRPTGQYHALTASVRAGPGRSAGRRCHRSHHPLLDTLPAQHATHSAAGRSCWPIAPCGWRLGAIFLGVAYVKFQFAYPAEKSKRRKVIDERRAAARHASAANRASHVFHHAPRCATCSRLRGFTSQRPPRTFSSWC